MTNLALMVGGHWVDQLDPFVIRFSDSIGIRYYGLAYALGFVAGLWLFHVYARSGRSLLPDKNIGDFMAALVFGVLIGGRLGSYFLYGAWRNFPSDPLEVLRIWEGGMASHGGMIGVAVAAAWFARSHKIAFSHLFDLVSSAAPAGLFFGRIANFINGELWGKVSGVPWAVIFPKSAPSVPLYLVQPRHPSQLYEALLEGVLLFTFVQLRFWKTPVVRVRPGRLSGEFLLAYAAVRIIGEAYREPDVGISLIFGLSRGTFYSFFLVGFGLYLCMKKNVPLPEKPDQV